MAPDLPPSPVPEPPAPAPDPSLPGLPPPGPAPAGRRCRPLLVGYYGEHNLGDDALLEVLLQQLPAGCRPRVTARDRPLVEQRFAVETVDRSRLVAVLAALPGSSALVFGGGSLLQDATSQLSLLYYGLLIVAARLLGKPVLLWGQGLGPLRRRSSRWLVALLLRLTRGCSWRDPASAQLARQLGARAGVLGSDPVWAYPARPWRGAGGPIVLCFRPTAQLQGQAWLPLLQALERLAPGRPLLWLPFHRHQDRGLLQQLRAQGLLSEALAQRSRELAPEHPAEAMAVCAEAGLVLAMRLHGLILAAASGAPCAALSYDPKVQAAAAALGCPVVDLQALPPADVLLQQWQQQLDQPTPPGVLQQLRDQSGEHQRLLQRLLPG